MNKDTQTEIAAAALTRLEQMHSTFMQSIAALQTKKVNGGELETDGKYLIVTCLGVRFEVPHRPIARDGTLCALEYPFIATHRDKQIVIWRMFLESDNDLYAKENRQEKICGSGNMYLAGNLIGPLASALLRSALFQPLG